MADINLTITIPNTHLSRAIEYMNLLGGTIFNLEVEKLDLRATARSRNPLPEQGTETNKEYAERVFRVLGVTLFDAIDTFLDERDRYKPAIQAIEPPVSDVPDDILT